MATTPRITIAGAGFAALSGLKELRKRLPNAELSLVAPAAEFISTFPVLSGYRMALEEVMTCAMLSSHCWPS